MISHFLGKSAMFCILWSATMYAYTKALDPDFINASDVFALYSTHHSFLYMLSWIVLFEMFVAMRVSTHVYTRLSTHAYT
jgi:hypothetical protein